MVVKPASQREVRLAAAAFEARDAALARARQIEMLGGRAIVQEQLDGRLAAVSLVAGPDGIVSIAQQIAVHAWPRPVGVTARGRSVRVDPQLRRAIEDLLDALGWEGLAQLQFLVPADGRPRLIDFNPRLYGSLPLAIRAGATCRCLGARNAPAGRWRSPRGVRAPATSGSAATCAPAWPIAGDCAKPPSA